MKSAAAIRGAKRMQVRMMRVNRVAERRYVTALSGALAALHARMVEVLTPIGKAITAGRGDAARPESADYRRAARNVLDQALPQVKARATGAHVALEGALTASFKASMDKILPIVFTQLPANVRAAAAVKRVESIEYVTKAARDYADQVVSVFEDVESNFGIRWEVLEKRLRERSDVSKSRAELIARDQTGKLNGAIQKASQTAAGVTQYKWATAGDERVRESHDELDGEVFDWNGPGAPGIGHPGDDFQCRCTPLPILPGDEEYQETEEDA